MPRLFCFWNAMIKEPTVLILGAGASMPFGFPSGPKLVEIICNTLRSIDGKIGTDLWTNLYSCGFRIEQITEFANALHMSGYQSIDSFLERRPEYQNIGKSAIAAAIMPLERTETLFAATTCDSKPNWYKYLYNQMDCPFEHFGENKLSIITFNYDRSVETFLYNCLKHSHGKSDAECANQLNKLKIIHVHGQIGYLSWQDSKHCIPYDSQKDKGPFRGSGYQVLDARENIKIIYENKDSDPQFIEAKELIRKAKAVHFMGFGYHQTSMRRLGFDLSDYQWMLGCRLGGTSLGLGAQQKNYINSFIHRFARMPIFKLEACDIYDYLHDHVVFQ